MVRGFRRHILLVLTVVAAASAQAQDLPPKSVTWTLADSPVQLEESLVLAPGGRLSIEAGVEVVLSAGVSITVPGGGDVDIAGTRENPVVMRSAGDLGWGSLSCDGQGGTLTIRHADISGGQIRILTRVRGLIEDSHIHDSEASAIIYALRSRNVTMRRCRVSNFGETLFRRTVTLLEDCLFEAPAADAVDFDAAKPGSVIRQCTFRNGPTGTNTDAIDIGPTGGDPSIGVLIEDCIMHDFSDKGVSIGDGPSDAMDIVVRNCLIYNVSRGVQVKHASVATVEDCTIVNAGIALHGFEKPGGVGGGLLLGCFNNLLAFNADAIVIEPNSVLEIEYSNTRGMEWAGTGNINADPLFRDAANADFRLLPGSPCLGTGKFGDDMGVEFPVGGVPDVPGDLTIARFNGAEADLTWTDPDGKAEEFEVETSPDGVTWTVAATLDSAVTAVTIDMLATSPAWWFRVRSSNFLGASFATEPVMLVSTPADTDGDGLPNDFEDAVPGLDRHDPTDARCDLDFDGSSNLEEFIAGTDPLDPTSLLGIDSIASRADGTIEIVFTAEAGKSYSVEYSDVLEPAAWRKLEDVPPAESLRPGLIITDQPGAAAARRFYRLVTPQQP